MQEEQEKWINNVMGSLDGIQRAHPPANLFAQIEQQLDFPNAAVIPLVQWRMAAAAAVLLCLLNIFALSSFTESQNVVVPEGNYTSTLISNYNLYDQ